MNITLRQLTYFHALAETHHFGRAAEIVGVSQPALSTQLRELEAQLGGTLVVREAQGLPLTPLGREVLAHARAILGETAALKETARRAQAGGSAVRLGVIPTVAPYLIPPLLPLAREAEARLSIREAVTDTLIDEAEAGRIDAALIALPAPAGFDAALVVEEALVLALPPDEPAIRPVARAEEVPADRLLLLDREHCLSEQALAACKLRPASDPMQLGAASLGTLARLVASGQGVTLLPEMAAAAEGRDLALHRFSPPEPVRRIGLVARPGLAAQPWFAELAALLRAAAASVPKPGC